MPLDALLASIPGLTRNGVAGVGERLPNNSSLTFPNLDAEALIANLPALALSTGSACTTGAPEPSHVLIALGLSRDEAYSTLRIGLGRFTTPEDVAISADEILGAYQRLAKTVT